MATTQQQRLGRLFDELLQLNPQDTAAKWTEVLSILRQQPNLANSLYPVALQNWQEVCLELIDSDEVEEGLPLRSEFSPLHIFLYANANVEQVKELLGLLGSAEAVQAAVMSTELGRTAIHVACRCASSHVIEYLFPLSSPDQWPSKGYDERHWLPFTCALSNTRHELPLATMKMLLEPHRNDPRAIVAGFAFTSFCGTSKVSVKVLELFVEFVSEAEEVTNVELCYRELLQLDMDLERAKIFCKFLQQLPKLTTLTIEVDRWEPGVFEWFTRAVVQKCSLTSLDICLPKLNEEQIAAANSDEISEGTPLKALRCVFEGNHSIQYLQLTVYDDDTTSLRCWIDNIKTLCSQNPPYKDEQEGILKRPLSRIDLCCPPITLDADRIWCAIYLQAMPTPRNSGVNAWCYKLSTESNDFSPGYFVDSVDYILSVCSVVHLKLMGVHHRDFHHEVSSRRNYHFIQKALAGGQLRCLICRLESKSEHILTLFELLRSNNTLEQLDFFRYQQEIIQTEKELSACRTLLAEHNTSLIECNPFSHMDPTIQYYLDMNRFGRAKVRLGSDLLDLLLAAQQDRKLTDADNDSSSSESQNRHGRYCRVQSVLYGLLRESPGSWAPPLPLSTSVENENVVTGESLVISK